MFKEMLRIISLVKWLLRVCVTQRYDLSSAENSLSIFDKFAEQCLLCELVDFKYVVKTLLKALIKDYFSSII